MRPPTEEELNEEVDEGFALHMLEDPLWIVEANHLDRQLELEVLEITLTIVDDRWAQDRKKLQDDIRYKQEMLTVSQDYFDDMPEMAAQDQLALDQAKERLVKEEKEYEEGRKTAVEKINRKKLELAVVADILRRHTNHH